MCCGEGYLGSDQLWPEANECSGDVSQQLAKATVCDLAQLQADGEVEREAETRERSRKPSQGIDRCKEACDHTQQDASSGQILPRQQVHAPNEEEQDNARNRGKEERSEAAPVDQRLTIEALSE